jgi:hypothetical protein
MKPPAIASRRGWGSRARTYRKQEMALEIGGLSVCLHKIEPQFRVLLEDRYAGFENASTVPHYHFDVDSASLQEKVADQGVAVTKEDGIWKIKRGDFGERNSWTFGGIRGNYAKRVPSRLATSRSVPVVPMLELVRDVPGWPTWKEICVVPPVRIAKNHSQEQGLYQRPCFPAPGRRTVCISVILRCGPVAEGAEDYHLRLLAGAGMG